MRRALASAVHDAESGTIVDACKHVDSALEFPCPFLVAVYFASLAVSEVILRT